MIRSKSPEVPAILRPELVASHRQRILELYASCSGYLVRVHEELAAEGAELSYPALTAFCRKHGIGQAPEYLASQGLRADEFGSHASNVTDGVAEGLIALFARAAEATEWDRYEGFQAAGWSLPLTQILLQFSLSGCQRLLQSHSGSVRRDVSNNRSL